jgi:IMP cyclohydrolase
MTLRLRSPRDTRDSARVNARPTLGVMVTLEQTLQSRNYPGRGCVVARTSNGTFTLVYFLTGRSVASRARVLSRKSGENISVEDVRVGAEYDELRHYAAYVRQGDWAVFGNGDHVGPLANDLARGDDIGSASAKFAHEPDSPIFTPRIWVAFNQKSGSNPVYAGSARHSAPTPDTTEHSLWTVDASLSGAGAVITTYSGTPNNVTVSGVLELVEITAPTAESLLDFVWSSLSPDLRVAAFAITPEIDGSSAFFIA